jgi:hypothetical protein
MGVKMKYFLLLFLLLFSKHHTTSHATDTGDITYSKSPKAKYCPWCAKTLEANEDICTKCGAIRPNVEFAKASQKTEVIKNKLENLKALRQQRTTKPTPNGPGHLIVFFNRESIETPPGYLNLIVDGKHLTKIIKMDELISGTQTKKKRTRKCSSRDDDGDCDGPIYTTTTWEHKRVYSSYYYAKIELPPGTHQVRIEKKFMMGNAAFFRVKRHKKFHNVKIKPGFSTMVTHYWQENLNFGRNFGETAEFRDKIEEIKSNLDQPVLEVLN